MLTNEACDQTVNPDWYAAMVASSSAGGSPASWNSPGSPAMPSGEKARRSSPAENDGPSARRTTTSAPSAAQLPTAAGARPAPGAGEAPREPGGWVVGRAGAGGAAVGPAPAGLEPQAARGGLVDDRRGQA